MKYFELIRHIAPDILLIPANKNTFNNTSKNYIKYLEFAYMNIPVLAPDLTCYSDIIKTNDNGITNKIYLSHRSRIPEKFKNL